ncbi:GEVED domain-containing protein, partial [Flavivirga sp. 57AJ16]|uniref:DUF6923 family protein n=1 Tax=Flavivirga sp. 57AJ16 TaxID=3025307 RepID=UPI0023655F48
MKRYFSFRLIVQITIWTVLSMFAIYVSVVVTSYAKDLKADFSSALNSDVLIDKRNLNVSEDMLPFYEEISGKEEKKSKAFLVNSNCANDHLEITSFESIWSFDTSTDDSLGNNDAVDTEGVIDFDKTNKIAGTGALVLDGSGGVLYSDTGGNFMTQSIDELSVGFWIQQDNAISKDQTLFEEGNEDDGIMVMLSKDGVIEVIIKGSGSKVNSQVFPFPEDGDWHHIAFTYEENEFLIVYLDGIVKSITRVDFKIEKHKDPGGFGNVFEDNIEALESLSSGFQGRIDEAFYSYNNVSGGALLKYVQCLSGNRFSSKPVNGADAFQSVDGEWVTINFAKEVTTKLPNDGVKDPLLGTSLFFNAGGLNEEDNIIYSMRRGDLSLPWEDRNDCNFMVITEIDFDLISGYTYLNHVVGPIKDLPRNLNCISGDVYNNRLYISSGGEVESIYVINIDPDSTGFLTLEKEIPLDQDLRLSDFVIDIDSGFLYTVSNTKVLYRINLENGKVSELSTLTYPDGAGSGNPTFGAQFMDTSRFLYGINNNDGNIYRVDLEAAHPEAVFFLESEAATNNDGIGNNINIVLDFGDAPESYGTRLENSGPRHFLEFQGGSPLVVFGDHVDDEEDAVLDKGNYNGHGDDLDDIDDEDAFSDNSLSFDVFGSSTLTLPPFSYKSVPGKANIYAWLDFNLNGVFENGLEEFIEKSVPKATGNSSVNDLTWTLPKKDVLVIGEDPTYMRLRITTDKLNDDMSTSGIDERSIGSAYDGEVEDYEVFIDCGSSTIPAPEFADTTLQLCSNNSATADLTEIIVNNIPEAGEPRVVLSWHSDTPIDASNEIPDPSSVPSGTYFAAFHDTKYDCYTVNFTEFIVEIVSISAPTFIIPRAASCEDNTADIEVTAPLGSDYEYSLDGTNFQSEVDFTDQTPGDYTLTVRSVSDTSCTSSTPVSIAASPGAPEVPTFIIPRAASCTDNTADIEVTAPLGSAYEYSLDGTNFQSEVDFTDQTPGDYTLTVRSINDTSCTSSSPVSIAASPGAPEAPTFIIPREASCEDNTADIEVTAPLGSAYEYSLDGTNFQSEVDFTDQTPGDYTLKVRSINDTSCTSSSPVSIAASPGAPEVPTFIIPRAASCEDNTADIEVTAPLGSDYEYSLDGTNFQSEVDFTDQTPGDYTLTVRSVSDTSCTSSTPVSIAASPGAPEVPT